MPHLPITMITAGACGLLFIVLAIRVVQMRATGHPMGDGGNPDMFTRIRSHANFAEYVPMALILMALLEADGGSVLWLKIAGVALVIMRVFHAIGMPMKAPNFFRASGALGTFLLIVGLSIYVIILATTNY